MRSLLLGRGRRSLANLAIRNEDLLGQPSRHTHPHLIAPGDIMPGHTAEEYRSRRAELAKLMSPRSIAVIPSYGIKYGSQNIFFPFQQNNNLLYLTGFDEPDSCLLVERIDDSVKSILFVKDNDPHALLWEGPKCGIDRATPYFGVDKALPISSLSTYIDEHVKARSEVFHDIDANSVFPGGIKTSLAAKGSSITKLLHELRACKRLAEINVMKNGCKRSAEAFAETMRWSVHNRIACENSIAAKMDFECRLRGATGLSYVPVVASGPRSLILHYTRNNMLADREKDLMFMDAGGKFDGYCTDISRAWPLSGKFTEPQKRIYNAVLRVQEACIRLSSLHAAERIDLNMLHSFSVYLMAEELKALGFKDPENHVDCLYPHSIGHYLGLDLHDCPKAPGDLPFRPGLVFTIEPGLYIPFDPAYPEEYHGIGVRVEDDIVIEEQGCTVMTEAVPKAVEDIEDLLRSTA